MTETEAVHTLMALGGLVIGAIIGPVLPMLITEMIDNRRLKKWCDKENANLRWRQTWRGY